MIAPSKSYVLKNRNFYFGTFMLKNLNKELKELLNKFIEYAFASISI
jgi:hypothetical protein